MSRDLELLKESETFAKRQVEKLALEVGGLFEKMASLEEKIEA